MDSQERLKNRLDNVAAVEPILGALRTIALSSRLLALHRSDVTSRYASGLGEVLDQLRRAWPSGSEAPWQARPSQRQVLVVLGTERGLCGKLNDLLATRADSWIRDRQQEGIEVRLVSLGRTTEKALRRLRRQPLWSTSLPSRGLPPYDLAVRLSKDWLAEYESAAIGSLIVIHSTRRGLAGYSTSVTTLLPPPLAPLQEREDLTLPPILDGDIAALASRTLALWLCAAFYGIMLRSAVAEHTARYQLLEGAAQNAHNLKDELALQLQQERQEAITSEMQDLMAGAGLVGSSTVTNSARSRQGRRATLT